MGDEVVLSTRNLTLRTTGPNKLLPKYVGPFKVIARVGKVAYKLELPPTMKCHTVFHVSLLHKYNRSGRVQPHPPPLEVDAEGAWFAIDRILDHKRVKSGRKMVDKWLVQWVGYGPEHNEWKSTNEVTPEAIQEFQDRQKPPVPLRRSVRHK